MVFASQHSCNYLLPSMCDASDELVRIYVFAFITCLHGSMFPTTSYCSSPAAKRGNPNISDIVFSLLIIHLWRVYNKI